MDLTSDESRSSPVFTRKRKQRFNIEQMVRNERQCKSIYRRKKVVEGDSKDEIPTSSNRHFRKSQPESCKKQDSLGPSSVMIKQVMESQLQAKTVPVLNSLAMMEPPPPEPTVQVIQVPHNPPPSSMGFKQSQKSTFTQTSPLQKTTSTQTSPLQKTTFTQMTPPQKSTFNHISALSLGSVAGEPGPSSIIHVDDRWQSTRKGTAETVTSPYVPTFASSTSQGEPTYSGELMDTPYLSTSDSSSVSTETPITVHIQRVDQPPVRLGVVSSGQGFPSSSDYVSNALKLPLVTTLQQAATRFLESSHTNEQQISVAMKLTMDPLDPNMKKNELLLRNKVAEHLLRDLGRNIPTTNCPTPQSKSTSSDLSSVVKAKRPKDYVSSSSEDSGSELVESSTDQDYSKISTKDNVRCVIQSPQDTGQKVEIPASGKVGDTGIISKTSNELNEDGGPISNPKPSTNISSSVLCKDSSTEGERTMEPANSIQAVSSTSVGCDTDGSRGPPNHQAVITALTGPPNTSNIPKENQGIENENVILLPVNGIETDDEKNAQKWKGKDSTTCSKDVQELERVSSIPTGSTHFSCTERPLLEREKSESPKLRSSLRVHVKKGCFCCDGSPVPKKRRIVIGEKLRKKIHSGNSFV